MEAVARGSGVQPVGKGRLIVAAHNLASTDAQGPRARGHVQGGAASSAPQTSAGDSHAAALGRLVPARKRGVIELPGDTKGA